MKGPPTAWAMIAVAALMIVGAIVYGLLPSDRIYLDRDQLQQEAEKTFPISRNDVLYSVTLFDPQVVLARGSDRVGLSIQVRASAVGSKAITGELLADGGISYDPDRGELAWVDPQIQSLVLKDLLGEAATLVKQLINKLLESRLGHLRLYRLREGKTTEALAKSQIHSVSVHDGRVVIELR